MAGVHIVMTVELHETRRGTRMTVHQRVAEPEAAGLPPVVRTRIERAFDPDQIRRLKATSERDLIVGGPHLAAAMIATNLVDELHAFIHPIIIGAGTPWLPRDLRIPLELAGERRLGRAVHLHYRRS